MARSRKVFDTNKLIWAWHRAKGHGPLASRTVEEAREWPGMLIDLFDADAIVTPVVIEFVAGVRTSHELGLVQAFLSRFRVIDDGLILEVDWAEALRLAGRVPRDGRPRQLGDCLIRAIAQRCKHDVITDEKHFPHA